MVHGLPSQYIFMLICCFESDCSHLLCMKENPIQCLHGTGKDHLLHTYLFHLKMWNGHGEAHAKSVKIFVLVTIK